MRRLWPWILVLCACREHDAPKPAGHGSGSAAPTPVAKSVPSAPHHDPARPELPAEGSAAPAGDAGVRSPEVAFAAEREDRAWKASTEPAVRKRVPRADEIQCHQTTCRITFTGKMDMLSAELEQLQSDQSLKGIAQKLVLTAPEQRDDGNFSIRVYARFERTPD